MINAAPTPTLSSPQTSTLPTATVRPAPNKNKRMLMGIGGLVVAVLIVGGGVIGLRLSQQTTENRSQAAVAPPPTPTTVVCHRNNPTSGACEQQTFQTGCGSGWTIGSCPTTCSAWSQCLKFGNISCANLGEDRQGVQSRTCGSNTEQQYCTLPLCSAPTTYTCYDKLNHCAVVNNLPSPCTNTGSGQYFSSQGNCLNQICPAGSTGTLSGSMVICHCTDQFTGEPVNFDPVTQSTLPPACSGINPCGSNQTNVGGVCYANCTASAANCSTTSLTGGQACGTPSNTLQYCCPTGTTKSGNACVAYPTCDTTSDCRAAAGALINSTLCQWPGQSSTYLARCCPSGTYDVNGICQPPSALPICGLGLQCQGGGLFGSSTCKDPDNQDIIRCCPTGQVINHTTNSCVPAPTGPGQQCIQPGVTCSTNGSETGNCCAGSYCTGVTGSQKCNVPTDNAELRCNLGGGTCGGTGGFISFVCTGLTNGQCLSNSEIHNTFAAARARVMQAGGCGQVDTTCVGGAENHNLCGAFEVISTGCGGTPPGSPQPSPTPTPPAPVCLNIAMNPAQPTLGSSVTLTCGQVSGATKYEFRVKLPDGTFQTVAASTTASNVSAPFSIVAAGAYQAQCRICTGNNGANCQAFEPL